jgi:shikimate dehydrogenase
MSPAMHNDLFGFYGVDAHYQALHVRKGDLKHAVEGLKAIQISGFNVTVPHKVDILPMLDRLDPLAEAIGAVNTVVNEDGELVGYNTDGEGSVRGIMNIIPDLTQQKILIVGAGGAARAIYFTLASMGIKNIDMTNRTREKASELIDQCPYAVHSHVWGREEAEERLSQYDIIIQTTSIGMAPDLVCQPLSLHNLKENSFVSDIIYNPLETLFLRSAKEKGARTQNGIDMFVLQGALAFKKWTGILPDQDRMERLVLKQLGGKEC